MEQLPGEEALVEQLPGEEALVEQLPGEEALVEVLKTASHWATGNYVTELAYAVMIALSGFGSFEFHYCVD
jgi:hypothetical protein